ncbi:hypothetical protein bcere0022_25120 [Bacillus cereus Rock3-44]|nr:hypothetical protein bcere0022_25120 [Bacillus cereus Rock3-44]
MLLHNLQYHLLCPGMLFGFVEIHLLYFMTPLLFQGHRSLPFE